MSNETKKGPEINWIGAIGSGLGSVTSAVLLSTTGAAGTWIGAGIGTFIITAGGAIYAYYLQRAKKGIEKTADKINLPRPSELRGKSDPKTRTITAERDPTQAARSEPPPEEDEEKTKPSFKEVLKGIRWKRVAGLGVALFAVTMAIIFIFELATGRPVSSYTGGSSPESTGTTLTGITDPADPSEPSDTSDPSGPSGTTDNDQQRAPEQQQQHQEDAPGGQVPPAEQHQPQQQQPNEPAAPEEEATAPVEPAPQEQQQRQQQPQQQPQEILPEPQDEQVEAPQ